MSALSRDCDHSKTRQVSEGGVQSGHRSVESGVHTHGTLTSAWAPEPTSGFSRTSISYVPDATKHVFQAGIKKKKNL